MFIFKQKILSVPFYLFWKVRKNIVYLCPIETYIIITIFFYIKNYHGIKMVYIFTKAIVVAKNNQHIKKVLSLSTL